MTEPVLLFGEPTPDDIRDAGWVVAVHNDYRLDGDNMTFWLFTKDSGRGYGAFVRGEGLNDIDALDEVRQAILDSTHEMRRLCKHPIEDRSADYRTCLACGAQYVS